MSARSTRSKRGAAAPQGGAPWSPWAAAFAVLGLACGCEPAREERLAPSHEIERLAFVPPARVELSSALEVGSEVPLLVSAYELTRGEWRVWYLQHGELSDAETLARVSAWDDSSADWPASFLTLEEARRYAAEHGQRLLTASEWLRVACGTAAALYPWGPNDVLSVANTLEVGLKRPTPAGTFEGGRSPLEIYDLVGNVSEWVDAPLGAREPLDWAMGGSFLTLRQPLYDPRGGEQGTLHIALDARHRATDVGVRLCCEAQGWLLAHAVELDALPDAQVRLAAVGRRWGSAASALLDELARAQPAHRSLRWLAEGTRR